MAFEYNDSVRDLSDNNIYLARSAHNNAKGGFCNEKKVFICINHSSNRSVHDSLRRICT